MSSSVSKTCARAFVPLCAILLACTTNFAQEAPRASQPGLVPDSRPAIAAPQSILSLAAAPRPQGELLARRLGDATFEHAPANYHVFAAATVGTDAGVEVLTLNFAGESKLTRIESRNKDFVIEPGGTCREGNSYARGGACSLLVRFNPQGPGHRLGFIQVTHSAEAKPMLFGLVGNGYAPVVSFTPSVITTVPGTNSGGVGTIKSATNLTVDGGDTLYVADIGNDLIKKIDSSGVIDTITPDYSTPASLAVDSFGIIYAADIPGASFNFSYYPPNGGQVAAAIPYAAGNCTPSSPCQLGDVGLDQPANMTIDGNDNLFFEEGTLGAAEMPVSSLSGPNGKFNLWYLSDFYAYVTNPPAAFAVDAQGNLYTAYTAFAPSTCYLLEESDYAAEYAPTANRVAGASACGFSGDGGQARGAEISSTIGQIAFDSGGNLYFTDTGNQRVRRIDAATGIIRTIAGNGVAGNTGDNGSATGAELNHPTGVAVDSNGQVYVISSAATNQVIRKVGTSGILYFSTHVLGTSSATQHVTVSNTGNAALIFTNAAFTGANPGDFAIDPTTTSCILTSGATLPVGQSCVVGILFKPAGTGTRSASLTFNDNTLTSANSITVSGVGTAVNLSASSLTFGSETVNTATANQSVTLTNAGSSALSIASVTLTGTNPSSFVLTNGCGTTLAAGANCVLQVHFVPAATGPLTASITINNNGGASPGTVSLSGTGVAAAVKQSAIIIPRKTPQRAQLP